MSAIYELDASKAKTKDMRAALGKILALAIKGLGDDRQAEIRAKAGEAWGKAEALARLSSKPDDYKAAKVALLGSLDHKSEPAKLVRYGVLLLDATPEHRTGYLRAVIQAGGRTRFAQRPADGIDRAEAALIAVAEAHLTGSAA